MSHPFGVNRVVYDCGENGKALFVPVCPHCGRFVKPGQATGTLEFGDVIQVTAKGQCKRCGEIEMLWEGFE